MSHRYEPRTTRLPTFLSEVMNGEVTVPIFQREFVWSDEQRLELLDSVFNDRPFGALFLWRVQREYARYDQLGSVRLLSPNRAPPFPQYLIDGMQRVTTLYAALAPGLLAGLRDDAKVKRSSVRLPPESFSLLADKATDGRTAEDWEIFFDAEAEKEPFKLRTGRMKRSGRLPTTWVSTSLLFDHSRIDSLLSSDAHPFRARDELRSRVRVCRNTFNDYAVVLIPLVTDDPEEAVTAFTRINRGGTPMDEAALVHARVWLETQQQDNGFDLRARFDRIRQSLAPYGFDDIKDMTLLNSVLLTAGQPVAALKHRDDASVARLIAASSEAILMRTEEALVTAARFLDEVLLVRGTGALPSAWHLLLLVVVADKLRMDDTALISRVRRWFMATVYAEVLSVNLRMQEELDHLRRHVIDAQGDLGTPRPTTAREAVDALPSAGRFDLRPGRHKAFALSLAHVAAKYDHSGARHCARLLAQIGMRALPRLMDHADANLPEARVLCDPSALPLLQQMLASRPYEEVVTLCQQHLLSRAAHEAFVQGDHQSFLSARREAVDAFEREKVRELGLSWIPEEVVG